MLKKYREVSMTEKMYTIKWSIGNGEEVTLKSALTVEELPAFLEALTKEGKNPEIIGMSI